tara:strand:+ start:393 stop:515 length:123 start_codon:yes stop_codon:yes gene_type:complete
MVRLENHGVESPSAIKAKWGFGGAINNVGIPSIPAKKAFV